MAKGNNIKQLAQTLRNLPKEHIKVQTCWATVKEVDWDAKTMTATGLLDGLDFYNVLLGNGSYYRRPAIGCDCLIGMIENQDAATFLIDAESVEEFLYLSGDTSWSIREEGVILKQGDQSFKQVLNDVLTQVGKLCDEVSQIIVTIGKGPNTVAVSAIKNKLTGDLKDRTNQIFIE